MKLFSKLKKIREGSILAYTMILLFVMFMISVGIMSVTVIGQKSAGTTEKSTEAFQIASRGIESVLAEIKKPGTLDLNALGSAVGGACNAGIISASSFGGGFEVELKDAGGTLSCAANEDQVAEIKSVGTYRGTTRAIETAVAASGDGPDSWTCRVVTATGVVPVYALCGANEKIISGGCMFNGGRPGSMPYYDAGDPSKQGWQCNAWSGTTERAEAYANCCK